MSWLWRNDASPASFEKALARLSSQITAASLSLDKSRSRSRRAKALWTLYTTLAYLVSALILLLVLGPGELSLPHYGILLGAPLLIFAVRKGITAIFGWSISRQQTHVDRLQKQREEKIAELKKATRFDSTQELLSKYGGSPAEKMPKGQQSPKQQKQREKQQDVQRTGLPPPPTANIPGRTPPRHQQMSPQQPVIQTTPQSVEGQRQQHVPIEPAGFAPNAFPEAQGIPAQPHWYDRILDVMLGEDETLAKNRTALVCANPECRLVNGQAPPGTKTLEDVGRWRCQACGSWNGVEGVSEVKKALGGVSSPILSEDEDVVKDEPVDAASDAEAIDGEEGTTGLEKETAIRRVTRQMAKAEE